VTSARRSPSARCGARRRQEGVGRPEITIGEQAVDERTNNGFVVFDAHDDIIRDHRPAIYPNMWVDQDHTH